MAQEQVRVGDGRLTAAGAVAGWPGVGSGAAGPDLQQPRRVGAHDAAAAGADLEQLDRLDREREAASRHEPAFVRHLEVPAYVGDAVRDHADLRGRPAHVEADGALYAQGSGEASAYRHA